MSRTWWPAPDVADHNGPQWLEVKFCTLQQWRDGPPMLHPGWYVIRVCPCHQGQPVTIPYPSQARAERTRKILLSIGGSP
jgi:hypothetical protein